MADTCLNCGRAFVGADDTRYYGEERLSPTSFWSPAEYVTVGPYCEACWTEGDARDDERRSRRGYTDDEKARI